MRSEVLHIMEEISPGVSLDFDLWYAVCRQIYYIGTHKDLASLCLVSKEMKGAATPWLYRSIKLDFSSSCDQLHRLSSNIGANSRLVREVAVQGLDPNADGTSVGRLIEIIPSMPNLERFRWKARDSIPEFLTGAVRAHRSVTQIVTESCVAVDGRDAIYDSRPALTLPLLRTAPQEASNELTTVKRTIDTRAELDSFYFTSYRFPSCLEAVHRIDTSRLDELTLDSCNNIGYLFNGLLCNILQIRMTKLVISLSRTQSAVGYIGKEKIECFLMVYKSLKEIAFANMGEDRPSLASVLTQGRSLRVLKLYESRRTYTNVARNPAESNELEAVARICKACPLLEQLILVQECNCGKSQCCCNPSVDGNMDGHGLIHKSYSNPQSRHTGLQICSTTV